VQHGVGVIGVNGGHGHLGQYESSRSWFYVIIDTLFREYNGQNDFHISTPSELKLNF